jgi:Zn-dependent protease
MSLQEDRWKTGRGRGPSGARGGPLRSQSLLSNQSPRQRLMMNLVSTALMGAFLWWKLGPMVALAVLVGIFVHEFGHVLAMNALGCGPARMHIVPFVGGAATPARAPATEFKGVLIALAGPVFGLLAAIPFLVAAKLTGELNWVIGALAIAGLNLINLAPAPPLDGSKALGPALARIHPQLERWALILVGAIAVLWAISTRNWIFGLFVGLSVLAAYKRGSVRPWALKLTKAEWRYSLGLYASAVALCLGLGWISLASVGIRTSLLGVLALLGLA